MPIINIEISKILNKEQETRLHLFLEKYVKELEMATNLKILRIDKPTYQKKRI